MNSNSVSFPAGKKEKRKWKSNSVFLLQRKTKMKFEFHFPIQLQEPITWSVQLPHWAYVTAFSRNDLFLDYLFAENRLLELTWVIRSMKREEKKMAALCGDVFISKLRKFRLSFAVFQYSNPSFPYISQYPLQIFLTCELNSQECGSSLYFYLYLFFFYFRVYQRSSVFWFWPP